MNLLDLVNTELIPLLGPQGFRVVESDEAAAFDNVYVILQRDDLRLRIVRERSIVTLDVAPTFAPNDWVDSAVLMEYLGLSENAGFHDVDAVGVVHGIGRFVSSLLPELQTVFGANRWADSRRQIEALKERRATRMFG